MASLRSAYVAVSATVTGNGTGAGTGTAVPAQRCAPVPAPASAVEERDLRGTAPGGTLRFAAGDRIVVSGLPGSGKSTLMRRAVALGDTVRRIDSQDVRERWDRGMPRWMPYGLYRPFVRFAHFAGLRGALTSGASVVVHDCGAQSWVRNWVARDTRRRGAGMHLVLLDVPPGLALEGQAARGRGVSGYAFVRHRRAVARLVAAAEEGALPSGVTSVTLLDREAAASLAAITFE